MPLGQQIKQKPTGSQQMMKMVSVTSAFRALAYSRGKLSFQNKSKRGTRIFKPLSSLQGA
jgi:hypothetical protein